MRLVTILGLAFSLVGLAQSNTSVIESEIDLPPLTHENRWQVDFGLNVHKFDYKEIVTLPMKSTENAVIPLVFVGIKKDLSEGKYFLRSQVGLSSKDSAYDGSSQPMNGPVRPVTATTDNRFLNFSAEGGLSLFDLGGGSRIYVYSGIHFDNWKRNLNSGRDMMESYTWFSWPVGLYFDAHVSRDFRVGLDASVLVRFGSSMTALLSKSDPGLQDLTLPLGETIGATFKMPISYDVAASGVVLTFVPWLELRSFGKSELLPIKTSTGRMIPVGAGQYQGLMEPASTTVLYGGMFSAGISF